MWIDSRSISEKREIKTSLAGSKEGVLAQGVTQAKPERSESVWWDNTTFLWL